MKSDYYQQILEIAENLIQTKGYNAFSYRDIADLIGIKTSSIHYHFPTKADLGQAVVKNHIETLNIDLENLIENKKLSSQKKMDMFLNVIIQKTYLENRKMCLGGMLASDVLTLPEQIQHEVRIFFSRIENWLKRLLTEAIQKNETTIEKKDLNNQVINILSLLEGALLLSRLFHTDSRLLVAKKTILSFFV